MPDDTMTEARLAEIKNKERKVAKIEAHWLEHKNIAAEAKKAFDEAVADLRELIREELPLLETTTSQ